MIHLDSSTQSYQIPQRNAAAYSRGRLAYPVKLFLEMKKFMTEDSRLLDVGCGNGRATIPVCENCTRNVVGFDFDDKMIGEAKRNTETAGLNIPYYIGHVKNLLNYFPEKSFDVVTAFTAFHHFDDDESIQAIRRVLTPDGVFIVGGGGSGKGGFLGTIMRKIVHESVNKEILSGHEGEGKVHNTKAALAKNNFEVVAEQEVSDEETYTFEQALDNFKSRLTWNKFLTSDEQQKVSEVLEGYFQNNNRELSIQGGLMRVPVRPKFTVYRIEKS